MKRIYTFFLILFLFITVRVQATTRYVKANASGSNNGSSWSNAYTNFQTAVNASSLGDTLFVASGSYQPTSGQSFSMKEGVKIYGHFAGIETNLSQRNLSSTDTTKLIGNGNCVVNNYNNGLTNAALLDGFTLKGGNGSNGGGINNYNTSPTISNCTFTNDSANYGGGICNSYSSSSISNCTFINNYGYGWGGGISNLSASTTISNCNFNNNKASNGSGLYNADASPTISNCSFTNHSSTFYGGAIYNESNSTPSFINCSFKNNTALSGSGGAMVNDNSSSNLTNCIFISNSAYGAYGYGGCLYNYSASPKIVNCVFVNNSANVNGSVMYNVNSSNPKIVNSILWNAGTQFLNVTSSTPTITYSDILGGFTGIGNINSNPLFVDSTNGNFHLLAGSPCINTGNNDSIPSGITIDLDGNARIQGGTVDMGAYEYFTQPHILYVDSSMAVSGNGTSWLQAYKTLSEALYSASINSNFDSILIAKGTYFPTGVQYSTNRDSTFLLRKSGGIKLYGGYPNGGGIRSTATNTTILSGDIGTINDSTDNSYHVMVIAGISPSTDSVVVDGFTIKKGYSFNVSSSTLTYNGISITKFQGAGIYISNDSNSTKTVIRNCVFLNNAALGGGCGLYNYWSSPIVTDCNFTNNAAANGGGMLNYYASPVISHCTFSGAVSYTTNVGYQGAAMYNVHSSPSISGCTISGNNVLGCGGMFNDNSVPVIINSVFSGNNLAMENISDSIPVITNCIFSGNTNSAMFNINASPNITKCTFSGNTDVCMMNLGSSSFPVITNCIFSGNSSGANGGAMYNDGASPHITNCIFSGNTAFYTGGGMFNYDNSSPIITNCTFWGNTAINAGGGIYNQSSTPVINNCIIYGNNSGIDGNTSTVTYSDIQGGYTGTGNINANPMFVDSAPGNLHLQCSSPCINTGNNSSIPSGITVDFDSNARIQYGIVDMGAYEGGKDTSLALPSIITPVIYNQNAIATPLTATPASGYSLLWYTTATGGPANTTAPTPSTTIQDTTFYWVSQANISTGCESKRAQIMVIVTTPLAVNWLAVNGKLNDHNHAMISWRVQENNVEIYSIEKSLDGRSFNSIGLLKSLGDGVHDYNFTETDELQGTVYYRIVQKELKGAISYSSIIRLTHTLTGIISLYPNPTNSLVHINTNIASLIGSKAILTDLSGKVVYIWTLQQNNIFDIHNLTSGIYMLRCADGQVFKLLKQ